MPWKKTSDEGHKDKIKVDLEKGRVTHDRISSTGSQKEHEWQDTRSSGEIKSGWRGSNSPKPERPKN